MANTIKELSAKAILSIDGFVGQFNALEKHLDNLPKVSERATEKMNKGFDEVAVSIDKFNDHLAKSGKDFDMKNVQSELQKAQKELAETGNVSKDTMKNLNKEINSVEWKTLDLNSRAAFKEVRKGALSIEKQMEKLNDVKFLEQLPEDARLAGAKLLDLEKDANKVSNTLSKMGDDVSLKSFNDGLSKAKNELKETGKVSETTMSSINNDIKSINFDALPQNAKAAFNKIQSQADGLNSTFKDIGKDVDMSNVSKGFEEISDNSVDADGNVGMLAGTLGKFKGAGYAGAVIAVGAAFVEVAKGALEANDAVNELTVQTGATGKELEGLKKVMNDVYTNNYGENFKDVVDVLSTVRGATNLTGKELQKATENAILMRDSFDWEPEESINAVRAMMKNFNISQEEAFNLLAQGRQQMGKGADDILDTFKEYGSAFHEIGLDGEESMNMMNNALDAGIINTDKAADAVNEMSILMREMPKATTDAMDSIGVPADKAQEAFAKGGKEAKDMFFKVVNGIKDIKDPVEQNAAGIAVFGTMWEDAGGKAILALGNTEGKIKKSKDALKSMNDVKYNTITGAMQGVGRAISGNVLIPIQNKMMPAINEGIKKIYQFASSIKGSFDKIRNLPSSDVLKKLGFSKGEADNILNWFNTLKKSLSIAGGSVKGFFQLFKGNGTDGVITLSKMGLSQDTIKKMDAVATAMKNTFKSAFGAIGKFAREGISSIVKFFQTDGQQIIQAVTNIGKVIWAAMKFVWPLVKFIIVDTWKAIVGVIKAAFQVIKGVIQVFSGLFTGDFKKMWQGIKNIFFGALKLIWNGVQLMFYGKLLKGGLAFIKLFAGSFKSMWINIVNFFKTYAKMAYEHPIKFFTSLKNKIVSIFTTIKNFLIKVWKFIKNDSINTAKTIRDRVAEFFVSLWNKTKKIFASLRDSILKIWKSIKENSYNAAKYVRDKVVNLFKSLWTGSKKIFVSMRDGLSGFWKTIRETAYNAGKFVKDKTIGAFKDTWNGIKGWIGKIKDGVVGMKNKVRDTAIEMKNALKDKVIGGLNLMIDGVNWVADKIGMGKPISRIDPKKYSKGTGNGHPEDGWATVGDKGPGNGKGTRELVRFPNGRTVLFEKETTMWMPKGTEVLSNRETEPVLEAMRYSTGTPKAGGGSWLDAAGQKYNQLKEATGEKIGKFVNGAKKAKDHIVDGAHNIKEKVQDKIGDIWEYATNPGKLVNLALEKFGVDFSSIKKVPGAIMKNLFGKLKKGATNLVKKWFEESSGGDGGYVDLSRLNFGFGTPPGYPFGGRHYGLDLDYKYEPVYSTISGKAFTRNEPGGFGNHVWIKSGILDVIYGHLSKFLIKDGQQVKPGTKLGISGNTGRSSGPHLHYEMRKNGVPFDPTTWLKTHNGGGKGGAKGGSVGKWINQAISQTGVSKTWAPYLATIAQYESGGNPKAIQHGYTDVNTGGNEARGLMQVTPQTYRSMMGTSSGMMNPVNNIIASIKWIKSRYGSITNIPGMASGTWHGGYRNGGIVPRDGRYRAGEEGPEMVIPLARKRKDRANQLLAKTNEIVNGHVNPSYSTGTPVKKSSSKPTTYKIKAGDTLWDISRMFNTTVAALQKLNNIKTHLIFPNQILKLTDTAKKIADNLSGKKKTSSSKASAKVQKPSSLAMDIRRIASVLINKGTANPDSKLSKQNIDIGKFITDKFKDIEKQTLTKLMANIKAVQTKLDSTIKANATKIKAARSKVISYQDKNRDETYKIEALQQERALNGHSGYINVKTRLADGDTTLVNKKIDTSKKKIDTTKSNIAKVEKAKADAVARMRKAKTSKEKKAAVDEITRRQKELVKLRKLQEQENKNLKKYENEKYNLQNRYKVTRKFVKGRSVKTIDNAIASSRKKISSNNATIKAARAEYKEYEAQNKSLAAMKKNELLKSEYLEKLVAKRAALVKKLGELKDKLTQQKEEKESFKSSLKDNMMGYAGFEAAKGNTARDFVEFMKYRLSRLRKFRDNVTKVKGMGLDPTIIREMVAGGIDSAMPKVEALVAGGSGYIAQINQLQAQARSLIEEVAGEQANYAYDGEIHQTEQRIASTEKQVNAVDTTTKKYVTKKNPVKKTTVKKPVAKKPVTKKPAPKKPAAKKPTTKTYSIKYGDTLSGIAAKYHTSVSAIKKLNGLKSDMIYAGRKLKIPGYAKGGIVNVPQIAWIAEGGFAESIISHDPSQRTQQQKIWKETGDKLGFTPDDAIMKKIYEVLKDSNNVHKDIAAKELNVIIDKKALASSMNTEIASMMKYNTRGLANGR